MKCEAKRREEKLQRQKVKTMLLVCLLFIWISVTYVKASEVDVNCIEPLDNQFLELRATQVNDIQGQNKQVIMELWGNNVEFKRI